MLLDLELFPPIEKPGFSERALPTPAVPMTAKTVASSIPIPKTLTQIQHQHLAIGSFRMRVENRRTGIDALDDLYELSPREPLHRRLKAQRYIYLRQRHHRGRDIHD